MCVHQYKVLIIQLILLLQHSRQMIHPGKSTRPEPRHPHDNKENIDQNILKLKPAEKAKPTLSRHPALLKKSSEATTMCSEEPELDPIGDSLKLLYTNQICADYSQDIFGYVCHRELQLDSFLAHHSITGSLRAKMVDWMIEVLSSYKMSEETFFKSVALMDAYLKREERSQETKDIHLIGVASMFSAMKFEEIHPLRLSLIAQKIARKKFDKREIIEKESRMMLVLNFEMEFSTVYDIVKHLNHEIKLPLKPKLLDYLHNILVYLAKMCSFSHELIARPSVVLACAVYFIALKTLEQVNSSFVPEEVLASISKFAGVGEEEVLSVSREVLHLAKSFSKTFPSLNNLKRFNRFEYQE